MIRLGVTLLMAATVIGWITWWVFVVIWLVSAP